MTGAAGVTARDTASGVARDVAEPPGCEPVSAHGGYGLVKCADDTFAVIAAAAGTSTPVPSRPGDDFLDVGAQWVWGGAAGDAQFAAVNWHTGQRIQADAVHFRPPDVDAPGTAPAPEPNPPRFPTFWTTPGDRVELRVTRHVTVRLPGCGPAECDSIGLTRRFAAWSEPRHVGLYDIRAKHMYGYANRGWRLRSDAYVSGTLTAHELDVAAPVHATFQLYRAALP